MQTRSQHPLARSLAFAPSLASPTPPPSARDCPFPHPSHPSSVTIFSPPLKLAVRLGPALRRPLAALPRRIPALALASLRALSSTPSLPRPVFPTHPSIVIIARVPSPTLLSRAHACTFPAWILQNLVRSPHKRHVPGSAGPDTPRLAHGTVRGHWLGTQLLESLHLLSDTDIQLNFTRMPGSGFHRQNKYRWKGDVVSVNIWHTGRVHLQGRGSGDLARRLSELAPSSRACGRSASPRSDGDSSGVGNKFSSVSWGLCLMLFWWVLHLFVLGSAPLVHAGSGLAGVFVVCVVFPLGGSFTATIDERKSGVRAPKQHHAEELFRGR